MSLRMTRRTSMVDRAMVEQIVHEDMTQYAKMDDLMDVVHGEDLEPFARLSDLVTMAKTTDLQGLARITDIKDMAKLNDLLDFARLADLASLAKLSDIIGMAKTTDIQDMVRTSDIQNVARLTDLIGMVKAKDIEGMAYLKDLQNLASKTDLSGLARSADLALYAKSTEVLHQQDLNPYALRSELTGLASTSNITALTSRISNMETTNRFLPGLYTVDTLPPASSATGYVAFVTDLGGGADNVISDGAFWKHIRRGKFLATGPAPTFSIVALKSPTVVIVTGTINLSMQFVLQPVNLYPGYELTVKRTNPLSTLIGSLGALSIKAPNGVTLSIADQSVDLQWSGTEFIQIRP